MRGFAGNMLLLLGVVFGAVVVYYALLAGVGLVVVRSWSGAPATLGSVILIAWLVVRAAVFLPAGYMIGRLVPHNSVRYAVVLGVLLTLLLTLLETLQGRSLASRYASDGPSAATQATTLVFLMVTVLQAMMALLGGWLSTRSTTVRRANQH